MGKKRSASNAFGRDNAACPAVLREPDVAVRIFRSPAQEPAHPTGIFQARWADFLVREIGSDGNPCMLKELPSTVKELPNGELLEFILYKENRTTADALKLLAGESGIPVTCFGIAGSKDRRAVTVQTVTAAHVHDPSKLLRINDKWKSGGSSLVRVGHFRTATQRLTLSQSRGNRFVVILRELRLGGQAREAQTGDAAPDDLQRACSGAVAAMIGHGFVNYFGLQRFGNDPALPTHHVGSLLLRGQFLEALHKILDPSQAGLKQSVVRAAYECFERTNDANEALRLLGRGNSMAHRALVAFRNVRETATTAEGTMGEGTEVEGPEGQSTLGTVRANHAAMEALRVLPRRQLLLFVNSVQSVCFNEAVSWRLTHLNEAAPVEGDLVWDVETGCVEAGMGPSEGAATQTRGSEDPGAPDANAIAVDENAWEAFEETKPAASTSTGTAAAPGSFSRAARPPAVRRLTKEEASSGRFGLRDVLLPLPGHGIMYPGHGAADIYPSALAALGITSGNFPFPPQAAGSCDSAPDGPSLWYCPSLFDLPGCYRPIIAYATDLTSELVGYTDHTVPLEPLDASYLEALRLRQLPEQITQADQAVPAPSQAGGSKAEHPELNPPSCIPVAPCEPDGVAQRWAWKLSFTLPASVYATMLLRELLHEPMDLEEHARRSKALLVAQSHATAGRA